ncbi:MULTISPECIES: hypothetical protein [Spirulina sp. CCY15215]|uniref:hypothetical protein n=1 Tax=Spirulina sp. CCY15215 TaxID=2767591 RepID=UPI00194E92EF|nr:hypothetical protein [Spirulina major]
MGLTVTLTNRRKGKPVAYRAIQIQIWNPPGDDLNVITDENGQFTIDEKYRNIQFILEPKYIESGENSRDLHLGGWQNWESDTLNIPVSLLSGVEPRSLGAGITVALKIPSNAGIYTGERYPPERLDPHYPVNIPNPMEIKIQIWNPPGDRLNVTTDRNGLFLIDEKYRNLECYFSEPRDVQSGWVKLDNDYVEMGLDVIPREWLTRR